MDKVATVNNNSKVKVNDVVSQDAPPTENENGALKIAGDIATGKAVEDVLGAMNAKDVTKGIDVASDYLELKEGEMKRVALLGLTVIDGQGGEAVQALQLLGADGQRYVLAGKQLVGALENDARLCERERSVRFYEITLLKKVKGSSGFLYNRYSIIPFLPKLKQIS